MKIDFDRLPKKEIIERARKKYHTQKIFAGAVMPIRGSEGFRRLDYDYCREKMNVKEIMDRIESVHMNALGVVIKDTDGACLWDTKVGWNPTGRDVLGEFMDEGKKRDIQIICSFTSMNDAYQGHLHPERASVHGEDGLHYKKGDVSTHKEGEMRVLPEHHKGYAYYKQMIPFLTEQYSEGNPKNGLGKGYIPTTTFMCPTGPHVDYLLELVKEVVHKYHPGYFCADYIRYDGQFTDLCSCERCRTLFSNAYPGKPFGHGKTWLDWREDNIANYAQRFHDTIKGIDKDCITGWFCLSGIKLFTRNRIAQNWTKLSSIFDVTSPMIYPYLLGSEIAGFRWKLLGDIAFQYEVANMKARFKEYRNPVLTITNTLECSPREMLKQMNAFDFGLGIALFKYEGTSEAQWVALKEYGEKLLKEGE